MIKKYCDRCDKEILASSDLNVVSITRKTVKERYDRDLCYDCISSLCRWICESDTL